jgi:hypothetical protein
LKMAFFGGGSFVGAPNSSQASASFAATSAPASALAFGAEVVVHQTSSFGSGPSAFGAAQAAGGCGVFEQQQGSGISGQEAVSFVRNQQTDVGALDPAARQIDVGAHFAPLAGFAASTPAVVFGAAPAANAYGDSSFGGGAAALGLFGSVGFGGAGTGCFSGGGITSHTFARSSALSIAPLPSTAVINSSATTTAVFPQAVHVMNNASFSVLFSAPASSALSLSTASAAAASAFGVRASTETHPDLPPELLQRIMTSDPALAKLQIRGKRNFEEAGCRVLARALSLNTCITSLDLYCTSVGAAGACVLFPALTHLTAMTYIDLISTGLGSSGASHLCSALSHLMSITTLYLYGNQLTADDGARICGAAAAAGMTCLEKLGLEGNGFTASDVVGCEAWMELNLPQLPGHLVAFASADFSILVKYVMSSDRAAFAESVQKYHPDLPLELLQRIRTSDPALTKLEIQG